MLLVQLGLSFTTVSVNYSYFNPRCGVSLSERQMCLNRNSLFKEIFRY